MMAGQTINDRLLAARHSIAGQGLAKSVCKATTEEMIAPKKKHLDYLVHCTNEPNVSIPQLANLLVERTQNTNWVVVYKALITVHHLLAYGNERFTQYLASSNSTFQLSNFLDKSGVQGAAGARIVFRVYLPVLSLMCHIVKSAVTFVGIGEDNKRSGDVSGYDMSPFIRRYAKYLNEKALSYRTVAFDFCKVKRGKEEGSLRMMNAEKLLKTVPVLQAQLDALLEFDCTANDLTNGVINMCFMLLFRDLIRLFACYNDGIINLLEKYFDMNKKNCRDALDLYKKFLIRMDRVGEFLKVAENVGIDKGDIPDLTKAPSSLLDALEGHLATLEGKKANTPTQTASAQKNVASVMGALSSTSSAFGSAAASTRLDNQPANGSQAAFIDDVLRQQALAEEEAAMNQYKVKLWQGDWVGDEEEIMSQLNKVQSPTNSASMTNPFLDLKPQGQGQGSQGQGQSIVDLFGPDPQQPEPVRASDDLLSLGNPFADMFGAAAPAPAGGAAGPGAGAWPSANGVQATPFPPHQPMGGAFVSDVNFSNAFTAPQDPAANPFMGMGGGPMGGKMGMPMGGAMGMPMGGAMGASPARPPPPAKPRSAFDDLEDMMKSSLGGSPSRPAPQAAQAPPPQQAPPPAMFGSPLRQPMQQPIVQQPTSQQAGAPGAPGKLTGDLDSALASLANNLTINKSAAQNVKPVQWNSPKNGSKSGAWSPQPMAATTGAGYRPMGQGIQLAPVPHTFPSLPSPVYAMQQPSLMGMPASPLLPLGGMGVQPLRPAMPSTSTNNFS